MPLPTLVVTHGRDQRWQIGTTMQREWADALRFGLKRAQAPYWESIEVRFAFYGDLWRDDLEAERSEDDVSPIQEEVAREIVARAGDGGAGVRDAGDERSFFSTLTKLAGFVDEQVGIGGEVVLQLFLKDLAEYFRDPKRRALANGVVATEVKAAPGDVILMGHSMGTIVSYLSLFEEKAALERVRGFLTFGSPLGMDSMQRHVREIVPGLSFPDQPLRWVNVFNDEDFATMVPRLAGIYRSTDGRVVEDVAAVGKPPSPGDPGRGHDPLIYLSSRGLATQLRSLIDGGDSDERGAPPWLDEDVAADGDRGDRDVAMANGGAVRDPQPIPEEAADDEPVTRGIDPDTLERITGDRGTRAEPPDHPTRAMPPGAGAAASPGRLPPVERTLSADFPPVVAPGSERDLLIAIAGRAVFGGGEQTFVIEPRAGETQVDLRIGVYAPDFDVSLPTGEPVAVTGVTLDLVHPDRIDARFRLRAAKVKLPTESSIWVSVSRGTLPIGQLELRTRIDPAYVAPSGEIKLTFTSAPDPDVVLIVSDRSEDTVGKGPFDLRVSREGKFVDLEIGRWKVTADAWSTARDILEQYRAVNQLRDPKQQIKKATGIGVDLWWKLPDEFRDFYWEELHNGSARSIAVYSQEPYIPWELIVPQRQRGGKTEPMLGIRYSIARWKTGRHFPDPLVVSGMSVIAPDYPVGALPEAAKEAQDLIATYGAKPVAGELKAVTKLLKTKGTQLIHFAGHGAYDPANVDDSEIRLSDGKLNPNDLYEASIGRSDRPFVFLNACQVGEEGWDLTQIGGWAESFCAIGFTGFVGPYWKVNDLVAHKAARVFYGSLKLGQTVGEAMQSVRGRFLDDDEYPGHTSWLAYSLHSHPNIHIKLPGA